jgi:valyl-tRNA synthetase
MSKSKGNGIDPLAVIDGASTEDLKGPIYEARPSNMKELLARVDKSFPDGFEAVGADALRFTLVYSCSEGQEMRLSLERFHEIGRRFITKLWNASRYVLLSLGAVPGKEAGEAEPAIEDVWTRSQADSTIRDVRRASDEYDFAPVGQSLYRFVWNDYCDWYLELTKPRMTGNDPARARRAAHALGTPLAETLKMLHPVTPFVTEELWGKLRGWFLVADLVFTRHGPHGGSSRTLPKGRSLSSPLQASQPTRHLPLSAPRQALRNRETPVGRAIRAALRLLARVLG